MESTAASGPDANLPSPAEVGNLGVCLIKRLWARAAMQRQGEQLSCDDDLHLDRLVVGGLGLGIGPTMKFLHCGAPTFDEFETWIVEISGGISAEQVARINAAVNGTQYPEFTKQALASIEASPGVLSDEDLAFWDQHGYVVLHDAVSQNDRVAAEQAIWDYIGADPDDPESWYQHRDGGIMIEFYQHPAFTANRRSTRIHRAFAQLWKTPDLWVSNDRCGFNAPEREGFEFQGPDLHWDVSLQPPIPFATQGILYLTDTPPEQGALTVVPGFHNRVDHWLDELPPGSDPRSQDLHALGSQPIGGRAGDLVIWHQALPHGSRPNLGERPRIVQYINMYPTKLEIRKPWV